jgi:GntR family transcriptional regulator / MocR family aminotransferase
MAIQWAGLSPELLIQLDRDREQPLRSQLEAAIRSAIREGRLAAGERLPSSRELARDLGVSRGLVQECYGQLLSEGYLDSRVGSATRVAGGAVPRPASAGPASTGPASMGPASTGPASTASTGPASAVSVTEPAAPAFRKSPRPPLIADFRSGVPDLASFPRGDWAWATQQACRTTASADFDYGDPRGSDSLRQVLAGYLRRVRASAAGPEDLIICTGYAQGLALVLRVLAGRGIRTVAFEDPGYGTDDISATVRAAGVSAVHVPVDGNGLDVAALAASGARAVVATPAHQSPTGVVLTPERRHALVEWARRGDGFLIEDDYDSEFRYDREPVGMVQGLAPDRVFAIGTVSKALAPALRIGWVLAPAALTGAVAQEKEIADRGTPVLDQLALALLLESGRYDRHLRRMRAVYARRRAALADALASHAPRARLTGLAAGFHGVLHLPGPAGEQAVVDAARHRSVGLYPMRSYRSGSSPAPPQLVLGFGNVSEHAVRAGIAAVADLLG